MTKLLTSLLAITALSAHANPVEIDTPQAHVFIYRPADAWSGDAASMDKVTDAIKDKKFSFTYTVDGKTQNGNPMLFGSLSQHPVVQGVVADIAQFGWSLGHSENRNSLWIKQAESINPVAMKSFLDIQNEYFKNFVISQGNPATIQSRTASNKIRGSLLAIGALATSAAKFGVEGGSLVLFYFGERLPPARPKESSNSVHTISYLRRMSPTTLFDPTPLLVAVTLVKRWIF